MPVKRQGANPVLVSRLRYGNERLSCPTRGQLYSGSGPVPILSWLGKRH
jgi:hypothetical protein